MDVLDINVNASDYLTDLLSAACLMIEDGLEITFSHRSFQEYFVALYISTAAPENQIKLIDRFWTNMRFDNVMQLLREINSDLFERALLVTKLESLFKALNVKKSVGITHLVKYIKYSYSEISYEHDEDKGMMFTYEDSKNDIKICQNTLLHTAAKDYAKYQRPPRNVIDDNSSEMFKKYFEGGSVYDTKTLNIKSQMVHDLNAENGYFSVFYLSSAYEAYKKLKLKHMNTAQAFDVLLGLK